MKLFLAKDKYDFEDVNKKRETKADVEKYIVEKYYKQKSKKSKSLIRLIL